MSWKRVADHWDWDKKKLPTTKFVYVKPQFSAEQRKYHIIVCQHRAVLQNQSYSVLTFAPVTCSHSQYADIIVFS